MHALDEVYTWTYNVLKYGLLALHVWAFLDCCIRKAAAFPAADKLTKQAWLALTLLAGVFGWFIPPVAGIISLISLIVVAVYLADVRPAVRDIVGR